MLEFNNLKEMEKYYCKETNTYVFDDDIKIKFDLDIESNINARNIDSFDIIANNIDARHINTMDIKAGKINTWNICARNIIASNINAWDICACDINANDIYALDIDADDINAYNIKAMNINYYAVCFAYKNIKCKSIKGNRENCKHFVLDGKLIIEGEDDDSNN